MAKSKTIDKILKVSKNIKTDLDCGFTYIPGVTSLEDLGKWAEKVSKKIK